MATVEVVIRRFFDKVIFDDCWIWSAYTTDSGYGYYTVDLDMCRKTNYRAHRFSWIIHNGDIPTGMNVLHKCDNKRCVNPDHLYLGTQVDNARDSLQRGQMTSETQGKLTWEEVRNIRLLHSNGAKYKDMARIFNVSIGCINYIVNNRTWVEG